MENDHAHRPSRVLNSRGYSFGAALAADFPANSKINLMLLLAIDTSAKQGSIALAQAGEQAGADEVEVIETVALIGGTFSAQLVPQIATLLSNHQLTKREIGAFVVVSGPGSFTGLRIGLAAVKGFAEVLQRPIAAVSMLEVIALLSGVQGRIMAALDAGRADIYVGEYDIPANDRSPRERILSRSEFLSEAQGLKLATPDAAVAEAARAAGLAVSLVPPVSADAVARLGWMKIKSGDAVTPDQLEANYIRRTDAEILEKSRG